MIGNWLGHLGTLIAILVIVWSCLKTLQVNATTGNVQIWLQLVTYYARFWVLWLLVWANEQLMFNNQTVYWLLIALSLLYLYMTWVEPNRIRVAYHSIELDVSDRQNLPKQTELPVLLHPTKGQSATANTKVVNHPSFTKNITSPNSLDNIARFAVLSDIHVGIFSNKKQLERLVHCLNHLQVDAVLILGDWLYHAGADLIGQMMILKSLNKPCYSVLSQADNDQATAYEDSKTSNLPTERLTSVLPSLGIKLLSESGLTIAGIKVMGISDGVNADVPRLIQQHTQAGHPLIIVTHDIKQLEANPRTLSDAHNNTLIIAGQTHGGQVNIPLLTPLMVKALTGNKLAAGRRLPSMKHASKLDIQQKFAQRYQVWINTGIGMTGLPFRLNCPPTIDLLTIKINDNETA